jgi:murein hydrolase activator
MRWTSTMNDGALESRSIRELLGRLLRRGAGALALLLLALPATGQSSDEQRELSRLRSEISRLQKNLQQVQSEAESVERQVQALTLQLELFGRELDLAAVAREQLELERAGFEREIDELRDRIERQRRVVARRLVQIERLGNLGYLRLLLSVDRQQNPFEAISTLSFLVTRDSREIGRLRLAQQELDEKERALAERRDQLAALAARVELKQREIETTRAEQKKLLAGLQLERRRSSVRIAELEERARRLERLFAVLYQREEGAAPIASISEVKGALQWPLRGKVIENFGRQRSPRFHTFTVNNGIRIEAPVNGEVHSVFAGTVLFAQWFKGYGNLVIIDHGDRVFSLYGNTRMSTVQPGEVVAAGQVIATVSHDEEGGGEGYLYFEMRENNKPVNPRSWLR